MVDATRERGGDRAAVRRCRQVTGTLAPSSGGLRYGFTVEAFDPRSALVVVDVQNDFADPAGSLAVRGGAGIVPLVNGAVAAADAGGAFVAYTQDWHPQHTPHFAPDGGIWPIHCVGGTWGAELHPELDVRGPRVRKGSHGEDGYSGFTMRDPLTGETQPTELEGLLRKHGVARVAICGLATDYCVRATALDAVRLGFATIVLEDAVRAVDLEPGDGERAIAELAEAGVAIESAAVR
jgi:nicotinamidase/pyrazinamidase